MGASWVRHAMMGLFCPSLLLPPVEGLPTPDEKCALTPALVSRGASAILALLARCLDGPSSASSSSAGCSIGSISSSSWFSRFTRCLPREAGSCCVPRAWLGPTGASPKAISSFTRGPRFLAEGRVELATI